MTAVNPATKHAINLSIDMVNMQVSYELIGDMWFPGYSKEIDRIAAA